VSIPSIQNSVLKYFESFDLAAIARTRDGRLVATRNPAGHERDCQAMTSWASWQAARRELAEKERASQDKLADFYDAQERAREERENAQTEARLAAHKLAVCNAFIIAHPRPTNRTQLAPARSAAGQGAAERAAPPLFLALAPRAR
jgi:hypothetical protein